MYLAFNFSKNQDQPFAWREKKIEIENQEIPFGACGSIYTNIIIMPALF
jgi:hypothetical protein